MPSPGVATLRRLTTPVVAAGGHECCGDVVTVLATTALRISESAGLITSDVDLGRGILYVNRQTYPRWSGHQDDERTAAAGRADDRSPAPHPGRPDQWKGPRRPARRRPEGRRDHHSYPAGCDHLGPAGDRPRPGWADAPRPPTYRAD